jgi:hypothetical protein
MTEVELKIKELKSKLTENFGSYRGSITIISITQL